MVRSLSLSFSSTSSSSSVATLSSLQSKKETTQGNGGDGNGNGVDGDSSSSLLSYFSILIKRLAYSLGIVYVVTEYGFEWTVCEGPSMLPTIKQRGEIVLIDRFTPKILGLSGGDIIAGRKSFALMCQKEHIDKLKQQRRLEQEHQKKEGEQLIQIKNEQYRRNIQQRQTTKPKVPPQSSSTTTNSYHSNSNTSLEQESSLTKEKINNNNVVIRHHDTFGYDEDIEKETTETSRRTKKIIDKKEIEETWYETRIPVNNLSKEEAWNRFWNQITTGISVGDVVVLQHPDRIGTVCKRVVGLPGDIVTKPSSQLGAARYRMLMNGLKKEKGRHNNNQLLLVEQDQRRMNRRIKRRIQTSGVVVPNGHIWVEGDNPWNSNDSRNYGAIPASLIMGRVVCRLWPFRGNAMMERGDRPERSDNDDDSNRTSLTFSGSIAFPVGWDDQRIVREYVESLETTATNMQQQQQQH